MEAGELRELLLQKAKGREHAFWLRLLHGITILGRSKNDAPDVGQPKSPLWCANEITHRVSNTLANHVSGTGVDWGLLADVVLDYLSFCTTPQGILYWINWAEKATDSRS
jgi:hypothetical protein